MYPTWIAVRDHSPDEHPKEGDRTHGGDEETPSANPIFDKDELSKGTHGLGGI